MTVDQDGSVDGRGGDGTLVGDAADGGAEGCGPNDMWYTASGCPGQPVCLYGPQDACAMNFCGCDGKSFYSGCGFADKPFASWGLCDGDVGDQTAPDAGDASDQ